MYHLICPNHIPALPLLTDLLNPLLNASFIASLLYPAVLIGSYLTSIKTLIIQLYTSFVLLCCAVLKFKLLLKILAGLLMIYECFKRFLSI
jgi:hypothetical protein